MSTKAQLQTLITAFTNGGDNTAAEFRTFQNTLLDAIYGAPVTEDSASPSILTPTSNANFPYDLFLTKQGGQVTIQGQVGNKTGSYAPSGQVLATFNAGEYLPDDTQIYRATAIHAQSGEIIRLLVMKNPSSGDMELRLSGSMSGTAIGVNKQYDIQNAIIYNTAA